MGDTILVDWLEIRYVVPEIAVDSIITAPLTVRLRLITLRIRNAVSKVDFRGEMENTMLSGQSDVGSTFSFLNLQFRQPYLERRRLVLFLTTDTSVCGSIQKHKESLLEEDGTSGVAGPLLMLHKLSGPSSVKASPCA